MKRDRRRVSEKERSGVGAEGERERARRGERVFTESRLHAPGGARNSRA